VQKNLRGDVTASGSVQKTIQKTLTAGVSVLGDLVAGLIALFHPPADMPTSLALDSGGASMAVMETSASAAVEGQTVIGALDSRSSILEGDDPASTAALDDRERSLMLDG